MCALAAPSAGNSLPLVWHTKTVIRTYCQELPIYTVTDASTGIRVYTQYNAILTGPLSVCTAGPPELL